jgi:glycosyltransferase 2 family protein
MPSRLRTIIVVALTVGLLALFLRNVSLGDVWAAITHGRLWLLVLALGFTAMTYVLRSLRWQYILQPIGRTHFTTAFRTTVIGFAASFLLPARAGEVIRPYLLARREGLSATATFATIILERLLDLVTVLFFFAAFLLVFDPGLAGVSPTAFQTVKRGGLAAAATAAAALVVCFVLAGRPAAVARLSTRLEHLFPPGIAHRLAHLMQRFAEGLAVVRQPRRLLIILVWSIPLWGSIAAGIWLASQAFRIDVPYTGSFLIMAILVVGVAVPTPGAVGGFHAAYRIGVTSFYHAAADHAVAAGVVLHAISFVPVTLLGILFMAQEGLSLGGMRQMFSTAKAEEGVE